MPSPYYKLKYSNTPTGTVLILVLIVIATMTILSMALAWRVRMEMKIAHSFSRRTQAYYLALGGIERAKVHLNSRPFAAENMSYFSEFKTAASKEQLWNNLELNDPPNLNLRVHLRDEESLFNINQSDPASWLKIDAVNKALAATILDWIDSDNQTEPQGAESEYYQKLGPPYQAKNGPMLHLRELLYLKGVSKQLYARKPDEFIRNTKSNSSLIDFFTVYGTGTININTVSENILVALPGLDKQTVNTIINFRAGPDQQPATDDDRAFKQPKDIELLNNLSDLQQDLLKQYSHFESRYFRIISQAIIANNTACSLLATLYIGDNGIELVSLEQLSL